MFGFPGDGIGEFDGALGRPEHSDEGLEYIRPTHEEICSLMATAHAKFTGQVGVCIATSSPGAFHLINGLYDAKMDNQPVVAIVDTAFRTAITGLGPAVIILPHGLLKNYWKQARRTAELEQLLIEARSNVGTQRLRMRAPTRNELPAEVVQAMIREYRRGASTYQLAAWHNVRRNTVRDVLRRNGVQMAEGTTAKLSPAQKDAVHVKRANGATLRALCAEFHVSESTIKRTLKRGP